MVKNLFWWNFAMLSYVLKNSFTFDYRTLLETSENFPYFVTIFDATEF